MQDAKDTFYAGLRSRLAALNPDRTVLMRGALRPAVLVAENELVSTEAQPEGCFVLRWTSIAVDTTEPLPLLKLACEIRYRTAGSAELDSMDRGRTLASMDAELLAMLHPRSAAKQGWTGSLPTTLGTSVFWSEPEFAAASTKDDGSIMRVVEVQVFSLREAGDA